MACRETPDIDAIDNLITMALTMSTLGVSADGLTTLNEMKAKVKEELNKSKKKATWTAGKAFSVFSETKDEDARKRGKLLQLYLRTEECLKKMDDRLIRLLDSNLAVDVKEAVTNHQKRLEVKEYVVLVAGETSAGKSSLVNLILGEDLLPYALLSTTSTICELKYGREKRIVAHYKKENPDTGLETKEILLSQPAKGEKYLDQLSPYLHMKDDRERGSPFKKIELFWPHELLEKGIVIVDSPGIGESEIMDEIVTDYLPEAFCFIYVINSTNAGGVQRDRIEKLLEDARKISVEREQCFLCECALFVCNKWDIVPPKETNEVKNHVIKKLKRCWPNLQPNLQVIYLSTTNATVAQRHGAISSDLEILINGIKTLVQRSVEARLQTHWKWLDYLLSRIIYHTKAFIHNAAKDREDVRRKLALVAARVEQIENEQQSVMKNLQDQLDAQISEIVRKLSEHLTSKDVQSRLTSWTDDDAPRKQDTWAATENDIEKAVKSRFRDVIEQWEIDNHVCSDARQSLLQQFSRQLNLVQAQIQSAENSIVSDSPVDQQPFEQPDLFTTGEKVLIAVTSPIWLPIGLVVLTLSIPVLGVKAVKNKIEEKSKLRLYDKDKSGYLCQKSKDYLAVMTKGDNLRPYIKEQLEEVQLLFKQIKAKIPAIIVANRLLLAQLLFETCTKREAEKFYRPINLESTIIRGNLAIFAIKEVRPVDINCDELEWKEDASSCLGRGGFATVYKGTIKRGGKEQPVALKVFNDVLNTSNAHVLLTEDEILRKLRHPNIVKFHGAALLDQEEGTRMVFVMELCVGNLKSFLEKHPERTPGKSQDHYKQMAKIIQWAIQISLGLDYIHKQGIVHRDLKTEKILISSRDLMKIADVGISKKVEDVTGTLAGTPIYIAPEVFASEVYDWRADIYSFGLILWEMWHGERVFSELGLVSCLEFSRKIREGYRPTPQKYSRAPPPVWQELMTKCWETSPEKRVTARKCFEELKKLLKCFNV